METLDIGGIGKNYVKKRQIDMHEDTRLRLGINRYSEQRKLKFHHFMPPVISDKDCNNSDKTKAELSCAKFQSHEAFSEDCIASELKELFPTCTGFDPVDGETESQSLLHASGEEEKSRIEEYSFLCHFGMEDKILPQHFRRSQPSVIPDLGDQFSSELTIFYNGTVNLYNVSASKADAIMFLAVTCDENANGSQQSPFALGHDTFSTASNVSSKMEAGLDLPMARKKSLQRFLEKRRNRINATTSCTKPAARIL